MKREYENKFEEKYSVVLGYEFTVVEFANLHIFKCTCRAFVETKYYYFENSIFYSAHGGARGGLGDVSPRKTEGASPPPPNRETINDLNLK